MPKEKGIIKFRYVFTNLHYILKKVWWICQLDDNEITDFGICNDDTIIRYYDDDSGFSKICDGFENLPFWFEERQIDLHDDIEGFKERYQSCLNIYLQWCHNHGIYPNKNKLFNVIYEKDDPLFFPPEHEYADPLSPDATLCIEYLQFGNVQIVELISFPVSENLPPCLEPEFAYSGSGDIYKEFFEFSKKYPRSATYYSRIFEEFGKEIFERLQEEKRLFIMANIDKKPDIFINIEDLHKP